MNAPPMVKQAVIDRILLALKEEHNFYCIREKNNLPLQYSPTRFCQATGISTHIYNGWVSGITIPNVFEMLEICRFTGFEFEQIMGNLPTIKEYRNVTSSK